MVLLIPIAILAEKRWVEKHNIEYEQIRDLNCLDSVDCLAFTYAAPASNETIVYKSTDRGHNWFPLYKEKVIGVGDSIYDIKCGRRLNKKYLGFGDLNRVFLHISEDGGKSFQRISFDSISALDQSTVLNYQIWDEKISAISFYGGLLITNDNWKTYELVKKTEFPDANFLMYFIDSNNLALQNGDAIGHEFVKYNIIEKKWDWYSKSDDQDSTKNMYGLCFINDTLGYACGGQKFGQADAKRDLIWKTIDKGKTWKLIVNSTYPPRFGLSAIAFKDENHGIAVGEWGKYIETTDGGKTWVYVPFPAKLANTIGYEIAWAGETPIVAAWGRGIWRLDYVKGQEDEILMSDKIKIRQTNTNLYISIEDNNYEDYEIEIANIEGIQVKKEKLNSGKGIIYYPISIEDLASGTYIYRIISNSSVVKSGKFIKIE